MHYYEVAPTKIIRATSMSFTYASETTLTPGHLVTIEVGSQQHLGLILRKTTKPTYNTKSIGHTVENTPLPHPLVELAMWLSGYYATHLATVLQTLLPRGMQKNRRHTIIVTPTAFRERTKNVFTSDQLSALSIIDRMTPGSALLHGVTGSGKTAVYIEMARRTVHAGQSVIILVPEIALTSQLVAEFSHHFEHIIVTHSRQTEAQRHSIWRDALTSPHPRVVIGPRSALFVPLQNIGLIVIDEAHEPSFKQENAPRYSALRTASVLASYHNAKLILGSATPSISDYYLAQQSGRPIISLPTRAKQDAVAPIVTLVDMTKRIHFKRHRFLSNTLLTQLSATFAAGQQALIFHNRRGSAVTTLCESCGWSAICVHCFIPLTLHADTHRLICHTCGRTEKIPTSCPDCDSTDILHKGIGTKRIESELRVLFPNITIARFDADSDAGASVDQQYDQLYSGSIDLIIGTQVVAKGLDLPQLRTVGVIQADAGLSMPDFSSAERTFQLLAQVVGRVGRSHHPTTVVVQSYQPTHPAIVHGLTQSYDSFYRHALALRKKGLFPPYTHLLKLTCSYKTEAAAIKNAQKLALILHAKLPNDVQVIGPAPAFYERQRDTYRWQLTLKSPKRSHLIEALRLVPATHWQTELDPTTLL